MTKGYVYVLTNPTMPGVVKIGKTTRSVEQRARELYHTGVPARFAIAGQVCSPDCADMERTVHKFFAEKRVTQQREFFRISDQAALTFLNGYLRTQLDRFVAEFAPNLTTVDVEFGSSCEGYTEYLAHEVGVSQGEIVDLLAHLDADDFRRAAVRRADLYAKIRARRDAAERQVVVHLDQFKGVPS
ncbi:MAG: GIY-YIG nuclease family protein [Paracoccus sp.]|nr:GIY-YIG nuclease family protein [Paracoccus sp. (in: a-proteobacteria)]